MQFPITCTLNQYKQSRSPWRGEWSAVNAAVKRNVQGASLHSVVPVTAFMGDASDPSEVSNMLAAFNGVAATGLFARELVCKLVSELDISWQPRLAPVLLAAQQGAEHDHMRDMQALAHTIGDGCTGEQAHTCWLLAMACAPWSGYALALYVVQAHKCSPASWDAIVQRVVHAFNTGEII